MSWKNLLKNEKLSGYDKMSMTHNNILSMLDEIKKIHMERWERLNDPNRDEMYYVGANKKLEEDLEKLDKLFVTFRGMR